MAQIRGADFKIEGLAELEKQFENVGKFPKKYLNRAGKLGIADTLRTAKATAPVGKKTKTKGTLKKSIKIKMETPNKRNKGVYRLYYNPKYTPVFQKPTTGKYGGETPYTFYPNAVEFGFKTEHGRVKGQYNMAKAVAKHTKSSAKKVVDSLQDSITELLNKQ